MCNRLVILKTSDIDNMHGENGIHTRTVTIILERESPCKLHQASYINFKIFTYLAAAQVSMSEQERLATTPLPCEQQSPSPCLLTCHVGRPSAPKRESNFF